LLKEDKTLIEVKNLTKKYGKFYAIRDVNFTVEDGEIVGFLGRNGAGKTTTMNIITGYIEATSGDVIINGDSINKKPKKVKKLMGYMPEGTPLYGELTVVQFINYMAELKLIPRKKRKEAVEKAIKEAGLEVVKNNLTRNLSRGYRQRVSLAGTIVGDPEILILDEPTVGLDPQQVVEIRDLIKSFRKNHTVLISSHILSEISQLCEKVVIIDKGEIVAVDSPKNLEDGNEEVDTFLVTVDDVSNKFEDILKDIKEIKKVECLETSEEQKTFKVNIIKDRSKEIRRVISGKCQNNNIIILEMKQEEQSLEDAFIKIIENRKEYSQKEMDQMEYDREIEALREEIKSKKEEKEFKKQAKKEEKARKKAEKEKKKDSEEGGDE
jgi:ABC-2 type transport system ATP-binding protein